MLLPNKNHTTAIHLCEKLVKLVERAPHDFKVPESPALPYFIKLFQLLSETERAQTDGDCAIAQEDTAEIQSADEEAEDGLGKDVSHKNGAEVVDYDGEGHNGDRDAEPGEQSNDAGNGHLTGGTSKDGNRKDDSEEGKEDHNKYKTNNHKTNNHKTNNRKTNNRKTNNRKTNNEEDDNLLDAEPAVVKKNQALKTKTKWQHYISKIKTKSDCDIDHSQCHMAQALYQYLEERRMSISKFYSKLPLHEAVGREQEDHESNTLIQILERDTKEQFYFNNTIRGLASSYLVDKLETALKEHAVRSDRAFTRQWGPKADVVRDAIQLGQKVNLLNHLYAGVGMLSVLAKDRLNRLPLKQASCVVALVGKDSGLRNLIQPQADLELASSDFKKWITSRPGNRPFTSARHSSFAAKTASEIIRGTGAATTLENRTQYVSTSSSTTTNLIRESRARFTNKRQRLDFSQQEDIGTPQCLQDHQNATMYVKRSHVDFLDTQSSSVRGEFDKDIYGTSTGDSNIENSE